MHDIDRTTLEYGQEMSRFEAENFESGQGEWSGEGGAMFSEAQEMELANELLSVSNEAELEQFLGNFLRKAVSTAGACATGVSVRRCRRRENYRWLPHWTD